MRFRRTCYRICLVNSFNSRIKSAQVVTVSRSRAVAEGLRDAVSGSNPSPVNWLVVVTVNLVYQIEESFQRQEMGASAQ